MTQVVSSCDEGLVREKTEGRRRKEEQQQIEDEDREEMVTQLLSLKAFRRKRRKRGMKKHQRGWGVDARLITESFKIFSL